ncbi:MAG: fluoride efflux transporter CrcB [Hyphomonadaceae bacterium]|nr:fluoride efflux transporter CrcB [Hyphomonadaceae bacterium]
MTGYLFVALGGAIGASLRHGVGNLAVRLGAGASWPWATFSVNVLGSFLMGLLIGLLTFRGEWFPAGQGPRLFLATGILGGFTTFSAFSLEVARFVERGEMMRAAAYAGFSVALGLAGVLFGLWLMRRVLT